MGREDKGDVNCLLTKDVMLQKRGREIYINLGERKHNILLRIFKKIFTDIPGVSCRVTQFVAELHSANKSLAE